MSSTKKVLSCLCCPEKYSEEDVEKLNYFYPEGVCFSCYEKGAAASHRKWCFGKTDLVVNGQVKGYGYDPETSEDCKKICPDRKICYLFVTGQIYLIRELIHAEIPFAVGSATAKAFVAALLGTTPTKLKKIVEANGGEYAVVLRRLRKQVKGDVTWTLIEDANKIRIKLPEKN